MDSMLQSFIEESRENLEVAGNCFLELEKKPDDMELMNELFRAMHTIKGNSGLFDIAPLTKVVHAAEDVLDLVRNGKFSLTEEHIDLFLDCMDQVNIWLDSLEQKNSLTDDAEEISQHLSSQLHQLLDSNSDLNKTDGSINSDDAPEIAEEEPADQPTDTENTTSAPPEWIVDAGDNVRQQIFKAFQQSDNEELQLLAIEYQPDESCFFNGDDPLLTVYNLPGLQWFKIYNKTDWPDIDALDPFQCNINFHILALSDKKSVQHHLRYITDQYQLSCIDIKDIIFPSGEYIQDELYTMFVADARDAVSSDNWQRLKQLLVPLLETSSENLYQTSALQWIQLLLEREHPLKHYISALITAIKQGSFSASNADNDQSSVPEKEMRVSSCTLELSPALNTLLETQLKILSMPCPPVLLAGRISSTAEILNNLFSKLNWENDQNKLKLASEEAIEQQSCQPLYDFLQKVLHNSASETHDNIKNIQQQSSNISPNKNRDIIKPDKNSSGSSTTSTINKEAKSDELSVSQQKGATKTLKVDQERIDKLMDLVGELVVAKNTLPFLAKRAEETYGIKELSKEIKTQYAVINRLSDELQSAMMSVRMVPVSHVFQRFPRLVRDLSRRLDKKIKLVLEGEETEADKNVIENLSDPLIHLVRNSLDHGIESPEQRLNAGKPEEGTLILRAIPKDDQVLIEIIDDGKGIDPDTIKRKAYEKKIIDEKKLDEITDQEAVNLIFAAGLSSKDEASDLSGRGVGMDVVKTAVNEAGGTVSVRSTPGQGTTITLTLPLSMAVTRVMIIEVSGQYYGIALDVIRETVRIPFNRIQQVKQDEVVVLRNKLIPLKRMHQLLNLDALQGDPEEAAILIVDINGEEIGLIIDDFHEGLDIIQKPLEGVMDNFPIYAGATLLGDGRVLLILDLKELI